jgi:OOP family OmpA-OmpF porin
MPYKISEIALRLCVFLIAGVMAFYGAKLAVNVVETRSVDAVQAELVEQGNDWATVLGDGLQVIIEGQAPSEAIRFRAMSIAGTIVEARRVIDNMTILDSSRLAPPAFAVEILRNDSGVSLIGLAPATTDREALSRRITNIANGAPVTDLLEIADYPVPPEWRPAMSLALEALEILPRSKISVAPGRVAITAISDSATDKRRLESTLAGMAPDNVRLALSISAPRPVISPYITRFSLQDGVARFQSCTADTPEAEQKIVAAAIDAGMTGKANCTLALGVPTKTWGDAVALTIRAVKDLGGGTATISDADISLIAPEDVDKALFDQVVGTLENALPDVFVLAATRPETPIESGEGPPQFIVTLSPEGQAQLRGRIADDLMNSTAENFAKARFGHDRVTMGTLVSEGLPTGWSVRVLAGIDALSRLKNGTVTVQPDLVDVRGSTGNPEASAEISRLLIEKLGEAAKFNINVDYVETLDPIAALPTPEECVAQINAATETSKILFDPGSATISAASIAVVDDIADILGKCLDLRIEVAGYTDSQGGEDMNQQLSQRRAEAVLSALRARRIPVGTYTAVGYGEADPIADNDTEEGREANRRIEFHLVTDLAQEEAGADGDATTPTEDAPAEPAADQ